MPTENHYEFNAVSGATLPYNGLRITATWPLARVLVTDEAVTVRFRVQFMVRLLAGSMTKVNDTTFERSIPWPELALVRVTRRVLVLRPHDGNFVRIVFLRRKTAKHLQSILRQHGIPIERARSIIGAMSPD